MHRMLLLLLCVPAWGASVTVTNESDTAVGLYYEWLNGQGLVVETGNYNGGSLAAGSGAILTSGVSAASMVLQVGQLAAPWGYYWADVEAGGVAVFSGSGGSGYTLTGTGGGNAGTNGGGLPVTLYDTAAASEARYDAFIKGFSVMTGFFLVGFMIRLLRKLGRMPTGNEEV